jgi:uracil-DNA glycosylase
MELTKTLENASHTEDNEEDEEETMKYKLGMKRGLFLFRYLRGVDDGWKRLIYPILEDDNTSALVKASLNEYDEKPPCYPPQDDIFNAFKLCKSDNLKVVILGQDPYHRKGQAMGLSFSVKEGTKIPPSLIKIFAEIKREGLGTREDGDLSDLAKQGILFLNAFLTVREGSPLSHKDYWNDFTSKLLVSVHETYPDAIFMLWGSFAVKMCKEIKADYKLVAPHPSPLSSGEFLGCSHFTKCNKILTTLGKEPIRWV